MTNGKGKSKADGDQPDQPRSCGIVMPISPTTEHDSDHWASVLKLLKKAIQEAGFEPREVWVASNMDMITDRILGNLFAAPILVCDITDHNPNVMFELGLRLSSRKPTVLVMEEGTRMPFDIKDFHAITYPRHLSYLLMEQFMADLGNALREKMAAFDKGDYKPFADRVTSMEILDPAEKEVPLNALVADRLETILARIERMESAVSSGNSASARSGRLRDRAPTPIRDRWVLQASDALPPTFSVVVPRRVVDEAHQLLLDRFDNVKVNLGDASTSEAILVVSTNDGAGSIRDALSSLQIDVIIQRLL